MREKSEESRSVLCTCCSYSAILLGFGVIDHVLLFISCEKECLYDTKYTSYTHWSFSCMWEDVCPLAAEQFSGEKFWS